MSKKEDTVIDMEFDGKSFKKADMNKYADKYSEQGLWNKITSTVKTAGATLIYKALQLFYVAENPNCPMRIKAAIFAALGYFISPIDFIPDFTPIVGYSDDLAAIGIALVMAQMFIDDIVIQKAKDKMCNLFGADILAEID